MCIFQCCQNCNEMFIAPWIREANWQSRSRNKPAEILTSFHYHHAYAFLPTFYPGYFLALLSELLDTPQSYSLWDFLKSFPRIQEVYSILRAQGKKKFSPFSFGFPSQLRNCYLKIHFNYLFKNPNLKEPSNLKSCKNPTPI